mmetsp:Transcript_21277/g.36573  ORF Transcript_21277/g.36573 Transcript_21277/m.36573 type:complete len:182 (+) Transcript_21277:112-657(+)
MAATKAGVMGVRTATSRLAVSRLNARDIALKNVSPAILTNPTIQDVSGKIHFEQVAPPTQTHVYDSDDMFAFRNTYLYERYVNRRASSTVISRQRPLPIATDLRPTAETRVGRPKERIVVPENVRRKYRAHSRGRVIRNQENGGVFSPVMSPGRPNVRNHQVGLYGILEQASELSLIQQTL